MIGRLLPILIFVLLGILLAVGLRIADHKTEIPSPLIGKPLPPFELPVLGQPDRIMTNADLIGEPFLLNVWASWCPTCRVEHPYITDLAESRYVTVTSGQRMRDLMRLLKFPVHRSLWVKLPCTIRTFFFLTGSCLTALGSNITLGGL